MADQCDPPPTATLQQTITQTQDQVVTSFSLVSDLSGTISVQTFTSCAGLSTGTGGGCAKETTFTRTATVDQIATHQVPFTQTIHNTVTITQPTKTLFGQCRQTHSTLSTPSPTIIDVPTTSTDDQGSTYVTTMKTTSTPPPTLVPDSTITSGPTDTATTDGGGGGGGGGGNKNIGPIVGGVVGGVVGLGLIAGLVWLWWKKRKRWDDIFDDNDEVLNNNRPGAMAQLKGDGRRMDFGGSAPYEYGVVGSQAPERHVTHASYSGISPGHSPQPSQSSNFAVGDPRYTMALPPLHQPQTYPPVSPPPTLTSMHSRTNSSRPVSTFSSRPSSPAHSRRRSRGPDEVIGLVALGGREMSPPPPPGAALPQIPPMVPTPATAPITTSTTGATTTQLIGGRVVMSATPQALVHTDAGRVEPMSPQPASSSSTTAMGTTTTQAVPRPNEKRPRVVMSAAPAPVVVHTDGGRVDPTSPQAASGPSIPERENSTGDDAPPAYS